MKLTLEDWITSSGKFPERATSPELTGDVEIAATILLEKVNTLLFNAGIAEAIISSGFRPSAVNAKIGGAKKSAHMSGLAIDLEDAKGVIKDLVKKYPKTLRRLGLFMEDPASTPTWCHLDYVDRVDRPNRIFKP